MKPFSIVMLVYWSVLQTTLSFLRLKPCQKNTLKHRIWNGLQWNDMILAVSCWFLFICEEYHMPIPLYATWVLLPSLHSSTGPLVRRPLAIQASKVCRSNIFSVRLNQKSTSTSNESTANYTQRNHKFMPFFGSIPKKVQNMSYHQFHRVKKCLGSPKLSTNLSHHHGQLCRQSRPPWMAAPWLKKMEKNFAPQKKWDGLEDNGIVNDHNDRARLSFLGGKNSVNFSGANHAAQVASFDPSSAGGFLREKKKERGRFDTGRKTQQTSCFVPKIVRTCPSMSVHSCI